MAVHYGVASSDDDLMQILDLQELNHFTSISSEQAERDGFVTVKHSFELLKQMNAAAPQIIAKDGHHVIGYALVMLKSFAAMIPVLQPMFTRLASIEFKGKAIADYSFYTMGQICIAESHRGQGVFDALYLKHKERNQADFDLCATSVSTRNQRSMRAHERVGFKKVNTFRDATDEWTILVWDW
jgi:hypothetical protein